MTEVDIDLSIEPLNESVGHCDCCGNDSRSVWGMVHNAERTVAAYCFHWTVGHLDEPGANLDFALGAWGDDTSPKDRVAVSLIYREPVDGAPAFMVTDANEDRFAGTDLVGARLKREEVIGTPLAGQVFALVDAIWLQDPRILARQASSSMSQ